MPENSCVSAPGSPLFRTQFASARPKGLYVDGNGTFQRAMPVLGVVGLRVIVQQARCADHSRTSRGLFGLTDGEN